MKIIFSILLATATLLLVNCKGSDTYRGAWKAMDSEGHHNEIIFDENTITIKDSSGKANTYQYTQNSVSLQNAESTYGIHVKNKGTLEIYFPNKKYDSGLIRAGENNVLYSIDRNEYLSFEDRFGRGH